MSTGITKEIQGGFEDLTAAAAGGDSETFIATRERLAGLKQQAPPITNHDLQALLVHNDLDDVLHNRFRYTLLPDFPVDVLQYALRCGKCKNVFTSLGHIFVPLDVIKPIFDSDWWRNGGWEVLGWIEKNKATWTYVNSGDRGGFSFASKPVNNFCCPDCDPVPSVDLLHTARIKKTPETPLISVEEIFPEDFSQANGRKHPCSIEIPPFAFKPDQWSKAFLKGLSQIDVKGKELLEIGVGTGINVIYLLLARSPRSIAISDIDRRCVPLACRNIRRNVRTFFPPGANTCFETVEKVLPYAGSRDLASWLKDHDRFDIVFGCLPQVVIPEGRHIEEGDAVAHYYEKDRYPSDFGIYGLALNDFFLQKVRPHLHAGGSVVLNLSGRPGQEVLERILRKNGFEPKLLHKELIAQHRETSLESLVTLEAATGRQFEFFADEEAKEPLNATQAEEKRIKGEPVFHRIYVYQGIRS